MGIWIRAICTKRLGALTPEELRAGIAARLKRLCVLYGEGDPAPTIARLRVERGEAREPERSEVFLVRYREDPEHFLRVERWLDPDRVAGVVEELTQRLTAIEEDEDIEDACACLSAAVEVSAMELEVDDTEGVGWPLAIAAAAYLADRGEGLIQADREGWMMPDGDGIEHLMDAD